MTYRNGQIYEYGNRVKRDQIKHHFIECYDKLCRGENVNALMRNHKRFIDDMVLNGNNSKNKYKTVNYLRQYANTRFKTEAMSVLTNTVSNINFNIIY